MNTVCTIEQFEALKAKVYRNIPRALLNAVIRSLPDYAVVVYLTLYDLAETNQKYRGTVMVSQQTLSKMLAKSTRSIGRAIRKLKEEGFIELKDKLGSFRTVNIIRVGCPKKLADTILEEKDREKSAKISINTPRNRVFEYELSTSTRGKPLEEVSPDDHEEDKKSVVFDERSVDISGLIECPKRGGVNAELLYTQYQKNLKKLRKEGISPLIASQKAFKGFNKEQIANIQQYILMIAKKHDLYTSASPDEAKMAINSDINDAYIILNNNRIKELLMLTIGRTPHSSLPLNARVNTPHVNLKNIPAVSHGRQEQLEISKKIRAMHRSLEFHPSLREKYSNPVDLIDEVKLHIENHVSKGTMSFKHALNAAAKMIRNGIWDTPKRLKFIQAIWREEQALKNKIKDLQFYKDLKGVFLGQFKCEKVL